MAELSRAEAYIAGPKGREYAAVALDRADSSAEPLAWEVGGRSPAYLPSHVAANAGFGAEPQGVRGAHFIGGGGKTACASCSWHLESGCLNSIRYPDF